MPNNIKITELVGEVDKLNKSLAETAERIKGIIDAQSEANKSLSTVKGLTDTNNNLNKTKQAQNELEKEGEKLLAERNKLITAQDERLKELTKSTIKEREEKKKYIDSLKEEITGAKAAKEAAKEMAEAKKEEAKAAKEAAKENEINSNAYKKLNIRYNNSLENTRKLAAQYGVNSKQAKQAAAETNKLGKELDNIRKLTGGAASNNVGKYFKDIVKGGLSVIGLTTGITALFNGIKNGIKNIADFEKSMSALKAVTGASKEEFKKLESDALRLGKTTQFTAEEVAGLQIEFAKLGFTTPEILAATEATLQLSLATGEDLSKSAEVAAKTLKGFGLNANETQRVVDVMAESFNMSALGLDNFAEAMKYVAPISKAAGVSIEETTAMLSALADAGISGSQAGTALRMILNKMSLTGKTTSEAIADLAKKGIDLAGAEDEVGRNAQTALIVLKDSVPRVKELTDAYKNSKGAAEEMSNVMSDNLIGDTKKLTSAWDGFILSLNDGNGYISKTMRNLVSWLTSVVEGFQAINTTYDDIVKSVEDKALKETFKKDKEEVESLAEKTGDYAKAIELVVANLELERMATWTDKDEKVIRDRIKAVKDLAKAVNTVNGDGSDKVEREKITLSRIENDHLIHEQAITEFIKQQTKERLGDEKVYTKELTSELLERYEKNKELLEKAETDEKESIERKKELRKQFTDTASELGNTLFDLAQSQNERELEGLRSTYAAKIEAAEGNSELQDKLAKELEAKELEMQQRQAKSEKNQALFNVAINTAQGISASLAKWGMPAAIPFMALAGALGLAQTAAILAQPLPGYFLGTEDASPGLAWVAEHGRELIETKDGRSYLADGKQLYNFSGGEKVHTAQETTQLLNSAIYSDISNNVNSDGIEERLDKMISKMDKMKQLNVNFDKNGMEIFAQQGNTTTKYLNRKGRK